MSFHKTSTGQFIVNKEYSNSAIGASLYESSADPTNLANMMRNASTFFLSDQPLADDQQLFESDLDEKLKDWDNLSDEELAALYAEAAQEDEELVNLGVVHYAQILEQEEEI